ncbi:MAG: hypothetical protein K2G36_00890 [Ruminococcus sp.]|nr:hypothetical protein [Ruminococcus sp.]
MKKILLIFLLLTVLLIPFRTYSAYNYNYRGNAIPSQTGYTVEKVAYFDLKEPQDIYYSGNNFYIADTGNDRILVIDSNIEKTVKIYEDFIFHDGTETKLKKPEGVYIYDDKIYIADTGNERVIVSDFNSVVIMEIKKPVSVIYSQDKTFIPEKILVDKSGNIYVISGNITTGCMMFSKEGEFIGFFGANHTERTIESIRNHFVGDKKKSRLKRNVPTGINNFDISRDFIYTCTVNSERTSDIIKKLNSAGKNIFSNKILHFGDYQPEYSESGYKSPEISDIDVSENGNINIIDSATGKIFQYDKNVRLLFIMGGISGQSGGFDGPSAIETVGGKIYILDAGKNNVTVFSETQFGKKVHNAVDLYNAGYYAETLGLWLEILRYDGHYTYAYTGLGYAYLRNGSYKKSMDYARLAGDSELYDKAFQEYRREFLKKNSGKILLLIFTVSGFILIKKRGKNN